MSEQDVDARDTEAVERLQEVAPQGNGGPAESGLSEKWGRDMFNDFDIDDPKFNEHFFEILDSMVRQCPVVRSNVGQGYWMVTRQADVRKVGQDWKTFSSAKGYQPNRPEGLPYLYPEESDPPRHTAWRSSQPASESRRRWRHTRTRSAATATRSSTASSTAASASS